ncbi:ricin-type beta-trefoil lectin domain protein [Demequina rhizosphaerae]|uniref:ricin-type beta-trefoil lectin domain protein n=1 Tax=Demequina rhizosphaerae TaxID=1638985 RepID=UPI0014707E0B|nr:ricin-type beta-trefoil lectin domain protein [Demequina rhizosphaerae]
MSDSRSPRRAIAATSVLAVGFGVLGLAVASPASAADPEILRGVGSGRCAEAPATDGDPLTIQDCDESAPSQLWEWTADKELVTRGDECADLPDGAGEGTRLTVNTCDDSAFQKWELRDDFTIQNLETGLCVDVWGAATAAGSEIALWRCEGSPQQLWKRTLTDPPPVVTVDLAANTGSIYGGATGVLYGTSDDGVPSDDLIAGQRPRTLAQKPPNGEQHPNGDVLDVSDAFFANGGEQMVVYMQDVYSKWPYQEPADIQADYLPRIEAQMQAVIDAGLPMEQFAWVPFNEPDGIWYQDWNGGERENFLADWDAAYHQIREIDPDALIVGPNEAIWHADRVTDLLTHAKDAGTLPDIMAWHELGTGSLGSSGFRAHLEEYRQIEADLGMDPLPINIDEYGNRHDMGNPGRLIQWLAMFEETKVDGDMAFWTYAGNLSDHAVQTKMANGGWWVNKWYSDLSGHTVEFTAEAVRPDSMQGIATLDTTKKVATVLLGGNKLGAQLTVDNIPADVFGDQVDVLIETSDVTGQEGETSAPMVNTVMRLDVVDGSIEVPVAGDFQSASRVSIVPATDADVADPDATWEASYEAEDATIVDAQVFDKVGDWEYVASNLAEVGAFNRPSSSVTFDIEVPENGAHELRIIYGDNKSAGQHALYIDDEFVQRVDYDATLGWTYRARAEVPVQLTAGAHTVSLRATDPNGPLDVNYDMTLDRLDVAVPEPDTLHFPAWQARLAGDVEVDHSVSPRPVKLEKGASAQFFISVPEDGYYDLVRKGQMAKGGQLAVELSGRDLGAQAGAGIPGWSSVSTTVYLNRGVSEVMLTNTGKTPVKVSEIATVRNRDADAATVFTEAEDLTLNGAGVSGSRWASGGEYVGNVGKDGGDIVWERPAGLDAGDYVLNVGYANNELNYGHPYNTDVVTRFMDTSEAGGGITRSPYRNNYSWDAFWAVTSDLTLTTVDGDLTFDRADGWAPNIDWMSLSPLSLGTTVEKGPQP